MGLVDEVARGGSAGGCSKVERRMGRFHRALRVPRRQLTTGRCNPKREGAEVREVDHDESISGAAWTDGLERGRDSYIVNSSGRGREL